MLASAQQRKELRIGMVFLVCSIEGSTYFHFYVGLFWSVTGNVAFNLKLPGVFVVTNNILVVIRDSVKGLMLFTCYCSEEAGPCKCLKVLVLVIYFLF